MCIICKDYALGKLTVAEAARNLSEVEPETVDEVDHVLLVYGQLVKDQKEKEENGKS